jgi:NAD(P)-dependent dehydrogenase (short-subunit alcohol dehydrogenase family)
MPLGAAARRFDLSDRVVVVTGASKGIGRELTILLAETGAVVVPTVRTDADAASVATEARSWGLTVHPQLLDVRDVTSINEAISRILAAHNCIDVLVNNAGLGFARAAFDVTEADWDEMMAVNLRRAFFMSQAAAGVIALAAASALDLAADLARRSNALIAVAPILRSKPAQKIVDLLLAQDCVSPAEASRHAPMTGRAARRLFDRLVLLGAVRELSGRPTFRLYGL